MVEFIAFALAYLATASCAFGLLIGNMRRFRQSLKYHNGVTNGDVVFCGFISAIPLVGVFVALLVCATEGFDPKSANWSERQSRWFND